MPVLEGSIEDEGAGSRSAEESHLLRVRRHVETDLPEGLRFIVASSSRSKDIHHGDQRFVDVEVTAWAPFPFLCGEAGM